MNVLKLSAVMITVFLLFTEFISAKELDLNTRVGTPFAAAGQKVELTELNGRTVIHLQWDASRKKWAEFYWSGGLTPPLHTFRNLKIRVTVQAGKATPPLQLMPRFTDKAHEVFPLVSRIKYDALGHGSARFILPYNHKAKNSWVNNPEHIKNGEVDLPLRLTGLAVSFPAESGKGEVYITGIDIETEPFVNQQDLMEFQKKYPSPFQFDIITGHSVRVVVPGAENYCYAVLFNSESYRIPFRLELTVRDIDGNPVGEKVSATDWIGRKSRRYYRIPVPKKFGIYYVDAIIESPGNPGFNRKITRSFAYMRPTGHTVPYENGQFRFGVNTHWKQDPETWRIEADACRTVGIRFIRDTLGFEAFHPRPDYWFHTFFDAVIDFYLGHGIQPELLLHGSASWAAGKLKEGEKPHISMPRPDIWQEFCEEAFRRYGNRIKSFEIWNEPDLETFALFSHTEYLQLVKIAYEARKKYAPQVELMSAGFCNFKRKDRFHEKAMKLCKDFFDVHCFHGHGTPAIFQHLIDHELNPMRQSIGIEKIPWYAHETALTATGFGEKIQAEALFKKLIFAWARGSIGYTWYDLRNDGFDSTNPEHNYGMLTHDYYPKAVYVVYNTLTALLGGTASFEKELSNDCGINAFCFRRDNGILVALWHDRINDTSEITLETDAEKAELVDLWGNRLPVSCSGGRITFPVSNEPSTLFLKNTTFCKIGQGVLSASARHLYFRKGKTTVLKLSCLNPFSRPMNLGLNVRCPSGIRVKSVPQVYLRPDERKNITMEFECDAAKMLPDSVIRIIYLSDNGRKRELSIPVTLIHSLQSEFGMMPFAIMDRREQIVELFDADPGNVFRLWTGARDLSAKLWIAADQEFFRLKVEVMDDLHRQPNHGKDIWKGDSLQVFCAFPGQKWVWQFGCALLDDGTVERFVWWPDKGFLPDIAVLDCRVTRQGMYTIYRLQIPWSAFGIKTEMLKQGFGFNLMINESDSKIRESWLQLAPGVGSHIMPEKYPVLIFESEKK
ncbi:MAG: hypothetical protein ACI4UV_03350 [Victivallales bacterium]